MFGYEVSVNKTYIIPLYVPTEHREKVVRLFFLKNEDETASHYCVVKNMSALVGAQVSAKKEKKYVCDFCLNVFGSQELLDDHTEYCSKHDAVNAIMPKLARSILKFKNIQNSVECPIKIYADFESFLEPIDRKQGERRSYINDTFPQPFAFTWFPALKVSTWTPLRTFVRTRTMRLQGVCTETGRDHEEDLRDFQRVQAHDLRRGCEKTPRKPGRVLRLRGEV